jgi:catechol 2,3-dioxygenase-like lactoylglutathione lyase family enzyme
MFAITLFTEDLPATKAFYGRAFGLAVEFEDAESALFALPNVFLNVLAAAAAPELIDPAPVAPPAAGVRAQFTINVDDVDARCAALRDSGIDLLNGPVDRPWGVRTATFRDPGGHVWEIASPLR